MKVGFTGTREGMTAAQIVALTEFFAKHGDKITEFHHGDCVGADAQAHNIACGMIGEDKVYVHPPDIDTRRAFCKSPHIARPMGYLARDLKIVESTERMIAAPKAGPPAPRSGTWYTVRRAQERKRPVLILKA